MDDASTLHLQAIAAANANDYPLTLALADRARRLTSDRDLLDRIDITASRAVAETRGSAEAVAMCERVLARPDALPVTVGLARSQLGMLHMHNADGSAAMHNFEAALTTLQGHPLHLGRVFVNRGMLHLQQGDPNSAAGDFEAAVANFDLTDDLEVRAKAVFNLGYSHLLRNDLVAAIQNMDAASEVLARLSPVSRAIVQQDRAEVLVASGRTREAIDALEDAAAAYGSERVRRYQAECEFVLARTLLAEDPRRARTVARSAARRFRKHGSEPWALRADAIALIATIEGGSRSAALLATADELVSALRQGGHRLEAERLALHAARVLVRRGQLQDATERLARIRVTADSPITTQLLAREIQAELAAARGDNQETRDEARQGLQELHSWQATFGSLDLQSSSVGHGQHLARLGLRAALEDGRPEVVFEWSERARALASKVTTLRPPPDPQLASDLTALRLLDPGETAKARALRERIRSKSWYAAQGSVGEPATLDVLQVRLEKDHAALVAHVVVGDAVTALVVTGDQAHVVPLDGATLVRDQLDRIAADLDFAAHNPGGSFGETVRASLDEDLAAVADELVTPLLDLVGDRRLVLTPSALLAGTPWTLLPGLKGRPLTVPTSATRWLELRERGEPTLERIGLVAGPRVERACEEVDRAAAEWPSTDVLNGDDANSAKVAEVAARVDVLHLAGHGVHAGDHPLFSAVELADGPWFGHDIDLLSQTPSVVVLSACELGQVSVLRGEESVGMTAAWLHAGARTVLSSPALVADDVACEALAHWHRLVAAGSAPADALAEVVAESDGVVPFLCFGAGW
ncbi:CHAT domain-containing protein [Nocardioides pocheonensis]|uniref:CHAT domain-containing protein n=1 Tax=Nocardioides pocheonensis TaxID=661485 RepID=A0A3N0GM61_9ACTN|nr:CHAT domain-containing protein [Nocardioides pocheonensis]RNM13564.1 CHAT domain-containing protein [Nocardioides pocheonensis]